MTKGDKVWMIQFYSDHSQACRTFADAWEASAKQLNGFVHYGRVNVYDSSRLYKRFRMEGTPSLMMWADGQPITTVAERPSDRWGGGGPLSTKEVTKMALEHYPDAIERLPAELGQPTLQLVKAWLFGEDKMAKDGLRGNMVSLLMLRDKKAVKKTERIKLRHLARKFRKHVRFLLVDIGTSQCSGRNSQCHQDLTAIQAEWPGPNTLVKEQGSPVTKIANGNKDEMSKAIRPTMLLHVPELTSRTIEYLAPQELQRRVSQAPSRCVLLLGQRGGMEAPSFPPHGFTAVMDDPLQHNLAQFRQVVRRVSVGKMGKEILGSDPPPKFMWADREKQADLAAAIDKAAGGEVLLAYFEGKMMQTLTKAQALEDRVADADGKFTPGLPPPNNPGLLKWLRSARQGLVANTLTDSDGSRREFGSGKSWVMNEDGPGPLQRLLELLRLDKAVDAATEYVLLLDQGQIFFLLLLLWVGYSVSGVASAMEGGDDYARQRGASSNSANPRNLPGRADTRYYSEDAEQEQEEQEEQDEEAEAEDEADGDAGSVSRERGVPASSAARTATSERAGTDDDGGFRERMAAARRQRADVADAGSLTELGADNVTALLGRDRRKPASLQLLVFRPNGDAAVGAALRHFDELSGTWSAQFRCCWVDCAAEPSWSSFGKRLLAMDAAADGSSGAAGEKGAAADPVTEVLLWRKGGAQCARYAGSDRTVDALDEWIRSVRIGDVVPRWHTLRVDAETELPQWPSFASSSDDDGDSEDEGSEDEDEDEDEDDSEDEDEDEDEEGGDDEGASGARDPLAAAQSGGLPPTYGSVLWS
jgi:hypothetical protein